MMPKHKPKPNLMRTLCYSQTVNPVSDLLSGKVDQKSFLGRCRNIFRAKMSQPILDKCSSTPTCMTRGGDLS